MLTLIILLIILIHHHRMSVPRSLAWYHSFPTPIVFGHRGLLTLCPENTTPAYMEAASRGFHGVEMDVVPTKNTTIICSHNFDLERETDGLGWIDEIHYADIKGVKTGIYSHPDSCDSLTTLGEACQSMPDNIIINVEIKSHGAFHVLHALTVINVLKPYITSRHIVVSSFNPLVVWLVKLINPKVTTALIFESPQYLWLSRFIRPDFIHAEGAVIDKNMIEYCNKYGHPIHAWTVNNIPAMKWLVQLGVRGIITDNEKTMEIFHET